MFHFMQVLACITVALAMTPAIAHALEYPGKRRLPKDAYLAVQTIYYPGFSLLGFAEPVSLASLLVLLFLTPKGTTQFIFTLLAFLAVAAMHAWFWVRTQPVNKYWLRHEKLSKAGEAFFSIDSGAKGESPVESPDDWIKLRDRWENSHVTRATLGGLAFVLVVVSLTLPAR